MKVIQFGCVPAIHSPSFAGIQKGGHNESFIDFESSACLDSTVFF